MRTLVLQLQNGGKTMSSVDDATNTMIQNLQEKTGKSLAEWVVIARGTGIAKHKELLNHLKAEYGLTYGYANLVTLKAMEKDEQPKEGDDLVTAQYAGAKAGLWPIYEALIKAVSQFGDDIELAPKKAYVSLRRKKQFGIIQPTTATRVDLGINLRDMPPANRLEASGSFNSMVSHRVRLSKVADVNEELIGWLRQAYDAA
jgi:predicted transport protein